MVGLRSRCRRSAVVARVGAPTTLSSMYASKGKAVTVLAEHHVLLGSDEGLFVIRARDGVSIAADPWDDNTLVNIQADVAARGDIWVMTGDQWGPFSVTTRHYDAYSPVGGEWEDVVEFSATTTSRLDIAELVDHEPSTVLVDQPGEYRFRVSARSRARDHEDEDGELPPEGEPVEWYLVEVWPGSRSVPEVVRLTSAFAQDELAGEPKPLVVPEGEAGLAAAGRIGCDVDSRPGARHLSGEIGSAWVERTIRGTRRKLFRSFAHATNWSSWATGLPSWSFMGGGPYEMYSLEEIHHGSAHSSLDQLSGAGGAIRWQFTEVTVPKRAVRRWNWVVRHAGARRIDAWPALLPQDSQVTIELTQPRDAVGDPWTTIRLEHARLPIEWVDDMTDWWNFQFAIADHAGFGTR
jgi:hypothetical protein